VLSFSRVFFFCRYYIFSEAVVELLPLHGFLDTPLMMCENTQEAGAYEGDDFSILSVKFGSRDSRVELGGARNRLADGTARDLFSRENLQGPRPGTQNGVLWDIERGTRSERRKRT
jgi:hypothetical protein